MHYAHKPTFLSPSSTSLGEAAVFLDCIKVHYLHHYKSRRFAHIEKVRGMVSELICSCAVQNRHRKRGPQSQNSVLISKRRSSQLNMLHRTAVAQLSTVLFWLARGVKREIMETWAMHHMRHKMPLPPASQTGAELTDLFIHLESLLCKRLSLENAYSFQIQK